MHCHFVIEQGKAEQRIINFKTTLLPLFKHLFTLAHLRSTQVKCNFLQSILKFTKIRLSVCLYVCPIFSPPSHGPISNLITFLESLHHGGANKIICSPLKAEIKKKLACKLFFSSRNVFLYVTKFFLYVTYKSKCRSKNKFYSSM